MSGSRSLGRRIVLSFVGFAAGVSVLFAASSFVIAYVVEDTLFQGSLREEVARQQTRWRATGGFAEPGREYVSVHSSPTSFPADLRRAYFSQGLRNEYAGEEGRHYHVAAFSVGGDRPAYLVAEVGGRLAVRSRRGELLWLLGAVAAAFLAAAAGVGYWLANRATAPLRRLADAVSNVPVGEVPRISAAEFPDDEVGLLARALESSLERTKGFVNREIAFTRDASHELRTPLSVIRSSAELIEAKGPLPTEVARPVRRMIDAAGQMERTVELLLLLAREEEFNKQRTSTLLLPLVEKTILQESERFQAERYQVSIRVPAYISTPVEPTVASAILGNLIGNVFRHASGKSLRIAVEGRSLIIADDGQGLPEPVLAFLKDSVEPSVKRAGLGLSIVTRLCRVHGIPVSVDSDPEFGTKLRLGLV